MSSILGDFNRIHVMSGGAPKEVFALLAPKFEQQTGSVRIREIYGRPRKPLCLEGGRF